MQLQAGKAITQLCLLRGKGCLVTCQNSPSSANIKVKQDKIDTVKAEPEKLFPITRQEPGCLQYDLHQDNENPAHFLVFENWESRELWQTHMNMAATDGMVEEFRLNEMTHIA